MKVLIFDMTDDPQARPQIILRLVDDTGCLRVQSPIYGTADFARNLGEILAAAFDTDLTYIGPSPDGPTSDESSQLLRGALLDQHIPEEQVAPGLTQKSLF
jgi:hypothetical protein